MSSSQTILVFGGSGRWGKFLLSLLGEQAVGTYHSKSFPEGIHFDVTRDSIEDFLAQFPQATHGLVLLGDTNPESCFKHPVLSHAINVTYTIRLIEALAKRNIQSVFISTDYVFDGNHGNYSEIDAPQPTILYGKQKVEVERWMTQHLDQFLILRMGRMYGTELNDGSILSNWVRELNRSEIIRCAQDQVGSPLHFRDAARITQSLIHNHAKGIYHIGGPEALSRIDMLKKLVAALEKFRPIHTRIEACSIRDFALSEVRPLNTSLCSDKASQATQLRPGTVHEACRNLAEKAYRT